MPQSQIRILTVIDQYLPMMGGAENIARFIVENTNDNVFANNILTIASNRIIKMAKCSLPSKEVIHDKYIIYRFKYARINDREKNGQYFRYVTLFKYVFSMIKLRHKYDIIHAHTYYWPALGSIIAGTLLNKPVVITGHNRLSRLINEINKGLYPHVIIKALRRADKYVAISRAIAKEATSLCQINPSKIKLIYNGIDTKLFCPVESHQEKERIRKKLDLPLENTIIIYHGRLVRHKNLETLIRATAKLRSLGNSVFTVIIGNGRHKRKLNKLLVELNLEEAVKFLGFKKNTNEYLKAADIYCLPSFLEGFSVALLEAMSTGLICIGSNILGNNEIILNKRDGYLFDAHSFDQLCSLMTKILIDKSGREKIRLSARKTIMNKFSIDKMVYEYKQLYRELYYQTK